MPKWNPTSLNWLSWTGAKNSSKKQKLYKTRQAREKHWQKLTKSMLNKKRKRYRDELDKRHSKYVRSQWPCVTCWSTKQIQNWHFISRKYYEFRWDDDNTFPQCYACNIMKHWNYIEYTVFMAEKYWYDFVKERRNKIKSPWYKNNKPLWQDMEVLILKYKDICRRKWIE